MGGSTTPGVAESPLQKAQADVASKQWQDYSKRWVPVQSYFSNRTQSNLAGKKQLAEAGVNTDLQQQYGKAGSQLNAALASRGVGAGSSKDIFANAGLSLDQAAAAGSGKSSADAAVTRQYESGLQDIVGMGRGQKASSDQALSTLADLSGKQAESSAQIAEQNAAGLGQAAGTLIGTPGGWGLGAALNQQSKPPDTNYAAGLTA